VGDQGVSPSAHWTVRSTWGDPGGRKPLKSVIISFFYFKIDMIAISVSTNYDDLLAIILPQNCKFFTKWYIITRPDDEKTIRVAEKYPNVELLFFDFFKPITTTELIVLDRRSRRRRIAREHVITPTFNKGGAIRMCQQKLTEEGYLGPVLLLDSDIYLPDIFPTIIESLTIDNATLYGTTARYDYHSKFAFENRFPDSIYPGSQEFHGYFQLYRHEPTLLYNESNNCSTCDIDFRALFPHKNIIKNMCVYHLGKPGVNWNMRLTYDDFKSD
jgi:hypothetical protein